MKYTKSIFFFITILIMSSNLLAQKQSFDVVTYSAPANWQKQQTEAGVQLSVTDKKTGGYAIAFITKTIASDAEANENFKTDWTRLVKGSVQVNGEPVMQQPFSENGWSVVSGTADYTDGSVKGMATLLTATGGGQMVSVLLMTNTQQYQNDLLSFINSLELTTATSIPDADKTTEATTNANPSSIVGLWVFYNTESNGLYNGFPQLTGGYMRREYLFNTDGTYTFRAKDWMVYVKDILFIYETGTYTVKGNQIIITPKKGKGEWWSKAASGRTSEWGKLVRSSSDYKLETVTYTIEFKYYSGSNEQAMILKAAKPTSRDGAKNSNQNEQEYRYTSRETGKSLIDNPPGFKTGFENKSPASSPSSPVKNTGETIAGTSGTNNASIAGLWTSYVLETNGYSINGTPQYTAGYLRREYNFYADGTYLFRNKQWLVKAPNIVFQYETGTYTVNGNQLTLIPNKGKGGFWKKTNSTKEWGSLIKSSDYSLEKTTYTFQIIIDNTYGNSIVLKTSKPTQRDGGHFNAANEPFEFRYSFRKLESSIDNPPGWKN